MLHTGTLFVRRKLHSSADRIRSIVQGNCMDRPPSTPSLAEYRPQQCVLYVTSSWLSAPESATALWLDGLYLRSARETPDDANFGIVNLDAPRMDVWVSNVTFQGDDGLVYGMGIANGTRSHLSGAPSMHRCSLTPPAALSPTQQHAVARVLHSGCRLQIATSRLYASAKIQQQKLHSVLNSAECVLQTRCSPNCVSQWRPPLA